jgi:hypothetical protein
MKPKLTEEQKRWIEAWRKSRASRPLIISHVIQIAERAQEEDFQYFRPLVEEVMRIWPAPEEEHGVSGV